MKKNKFKKFKMKNEYGKRREILPMHGGDASNSDGVLTRLASSGSLLVFLCDSTGVLSMLAGSGATLEMKLRL